MLNNGYDARFQNEGGYVPKPDNYMVWAILSTICCCLPFGIVAIVKASDVNSLYIRKQYDAAFQASEDAKKWSLIAFIVGLIINVIPTVIYICIYGAAILAAIAQSA